MQSQKKLDEIYIRNDIFGNEERASVADSKADQRSSRKEIYFMDTFTACLKTCQIIESKQNACKKYFVVIREDFELWWQKKKNMFSYSVEYFERQEKFLISDLGGKKCDRRQFSDPPGTLNRRIMITKLLSTHE